MERIGIGAVGVRGEGMGHLAGQLVGADLRIRIGIRIRVALLIGRRRPGAHPVHDHGPIAIGQAAILGHRLVLARDALVDELVHRACGIGRGRDLEVVVARQRRGRAKLRRVAVARPAVGGEDVLHRARDAVRRRVVVVIVIVVIIVVVGAVRVVVIIVVVVVVRAWAVGLASARLDGLAALVGAAARDEKRKCDAREERRSGNPNPKTHEFVHFPTDAVE